MLLNVLLRENRVLAKAYGFDVYPGFPICPSSALFMRHKSLSKLLALDVVLKTEEDRRTFSGTPCVVTM
jgi:hypothetical protein